MEQRDRQWQAQGEGGAGSWQTQSDGHFRVRALVLLFALHYSQIFRYLLLLRDSNTNLAMQNTPPKLLRWASVTTCTAEDLFLYVDESIRSVGHCKSICAPQDILSRSVQNLSDCVRMYSKSCASSNREECTMFKRVDLPGPCSPEDSANVAHGLKRRRRVDFEVL